jgi:hypothetical protein
MNVYPTVDLAEGLFELLISNVAHMCRYSVVATSNRMVK